MSSVYTDECRKHNIRPCKGVTKFIETFNAVAGNASAEGTLVICDLDNSFIGGAPFGPFLKVIETLRTIHGGPGAPTLLFKLKMQRCSVTDAEIGELCRVLMATRSATKLLLRSIVLDNNLGITSIGAKHLKRLLTVERDLVEVQVNHCAVNGVLQRSVAGLCQANLGGETQQQQLPQSSPWPTPARSQTSVVSPSSVIVNPSPSPVSVATPSTIDASKSGGEDSVFGTASPLRLAAGNGFENLSLLWGSEPTPSSDSYLHLPYISV